MTINFKQEVQDLLKTIGAGRMSNNAYDTSWIARLADLDSGFSNKALNWISDHQLYDGSWGTQEPFYYHDRVICTLSAMIALTYRGRRAYDHLQIERGLSALDKITSNATRGLQADPNGATAGFEMIIPTLISEAEKLGIIKQQGDRILGRLTQLREAKMKKLSGMKINRNFTPAFSSEMAGQDQANILDIENIQETNGSVANSPSATAYFALNLKRNNPAAMEYLYKWVTAEGGAPNVAPFDIFEPAWVLWNLRLAGQLDPQTMELCQPHLDFIEKNWNVKTGIGHASEYTPKDSDDSGLVFELLTAFGRHANIEAVLSYEEETYFRCFALEANSSISANIHVLGALRSAQYSSKHPSVSKILNFLRNNRIADAYWFDKWHVSPYYATSHAIIACAGYDDDLCSNAIEWIIKTQRQDGAWGFYPSPTAEETAYCLQALSIWGRSHKNNAGAAITNGAKWLEENIDKPYQSMWIGKALYCPEYVVRSTILSALELAQQGI